MATESTAIVRFISEAQQQANLPIQPGEAPVPDLTDDLKPIRRSFKVPLLVVGAVMVVGAATTAGIYIGRHSTSSPPATAQVAPAAPAATEPAAIPAPMVTPGLPSVVAAAEPPPGPGSPSQPAAVAPAVLAETGFDIRVKPPATISLDGRVLGKAPLRIRNLNPGQHVVDVEAPSGFFSRRIEIELDAGEPQNVNLALDPIDPPAAPAARADEDRPRRKERRAAARRSSDAASPAAAKGTLLLGSKPPCDIYIDGAATGLKTPQRAIELSPGRHQITLVNGDLAIKKSFTVDIEPGKSTREIHDLTGKL